MKRPLLYGRLNIVWPCPSWDWNENWPFPVLWSLLSFQICWHIECSTLAASFFRIWNSSSGIPPPSLACSWQCFLRLTWLHPPGYLALGEWSHIYYLFKSIYSLYNNKVALYIINSIDSILLFFLQNSFKKSKSKYEISFHLGHISFHFILLICLFVFLME